MTMKFPQSLHADGWLDRMPEGHSRSTITGPMSDELPPMWADDDEAMAIEPARRRSPRAGTWLAIVGVGAVAAGMAVVYAHDPDRVNAEISGALARAEGTPPAQAPAQLADAQAPQAQPAASDAQSQTLAMAPPAAGVSTGTVDSAPAKAETPPPADNTAPATQAATPPSPLPAKTAHATAPKQRLSQLAQGPSTTPSMLVPPAPVVQEQAPQQVQAMAPALPASASQLAAPASQPASAPASSPVTGE